ncbi:hypothetical protein [Mediterraneibacter gnavus]|uniref:hypothetical protein n=1 Tax=Mediterraneibacter gnavus TaxID=33038 RepID=UPI001FA74C3F|nr:hypothetical protein [Mediterraneibacter gnavus]
MMEDDLSRIVNAIRISRGTIRAVKQNLNLCHMGMKVSSSGGWHPLAYVTMKKNAILADMAVMNDSTY